MNEDKHWHGTRTVKLDGMRVTMDKAGRIVIPPVLRERLGMMPGPVDLIVDGTGIRIEAEVRGPRGKHEVENCGRNQTVNVSNTPTSKIGSR